MWELPTRPRHGYAEEDVKLNRDRGQYPKPVLPPRTGTCLQTCTALGFGSTMTISPRRTCTVASRIHSLQPGASPRCPVASADASSSSLANSRDRSALFRYPSASRSSSVGGLCMISSFTSTNSISSPPLMLRRSRSAFGIVTCPRSPIFRLCSYFFHTAVDVCRSAQTPRSRNAQSFGRSASKPAASTRSRMRCSTVSSNSNVSSNSSYQS